MSAEQNRRLLDWIEAQIEANPRLSKAGLARHLGQSQTAVWHIFQRKAALRLNELQKIVTYLGVRPPPDLLGPGWTSVVGAVPAPEPGAGDSDPDESEPDAAAPEPEPARPAAAPPPRPRPAPTPAAGPALSGPSDVTAIAVQGRLSVNEFVAGSFIPSGRLRVPMIEHPDYEPCDQVSFEVQPEITAAWPQIQAYVVAVPADKYRPTLRTGEFMVVTDVRGDLTGWRLGRVERYGADLRLVDCHGTVLSGTPAWLVIASVSLLSRG